MARDAIFDQPAEIGPLRWSHGWRDHSSIADRLFATVCTGVFLGGGLAYGLAKLTGHGADDRISPSYVIPILLVAIGAYVVFGPDHHCMCVGERGISIGRLRFGVIRSRQMMLFDEVDDVEIESTRIVSDAVSQIYMHTDLTFSWIDREGYEVFTTTGTIDEPVQRATPKYDPTAPLQLDGPRDRGTSFGFAAMEAFRLFKDQRPVAPYR